jgi:hypothetical protein
LAIVPDRLKGVLPVKIVRELRAGTFGDFASECRVNQFADAPNMIGDAQLHRRGKPNLTYFYRDSVGRSPKRKREPDPPNWVERGGFFVVLAAAVFAFWAAYESEQLAWYTEDAIKTAHYDSYMALQSAHLDSANAITMAHQDSAVALKQSQDTSLKAIRQAAEANRIASGALSVANNTLHETGIAADTEHQDMQATLAKAAEANDTAKKALIGVERPIIWVTVPKVVVLAPTNTPNMDYLVFRIDIENIGKQPAVVSLLNADFIYGRDNKPPPLEWPVSEDYSNCPIMFIGEHLLDIGKTATMSCQRWGTLSPVELRQLDNGYLTGFIRLLVYYRDSVGTARSKITDLVYVPSPVPHRGKFMEAVSTEQVINSPEESKLVEGQRQAVSSFLSLYKQALPTTLPGLTKSTAEILFGSDYQSSVNDTVSFAIPADGPTTAPIPPPVDREGDDDDN